MKNRSKPIMTAVALGVVVTSLTACPNLTGAHKPEAENQAGIYAKELGIEVKAVSCVKQDTDGDGYVSCTLKLDDAGTTKQVECAGAWNLNEGCRDPKIKMPTPVAAGGK